jgi:CDP-diacylglycerol pyrophosphatase
MNAVLALEMFLTAPLPAQTAQSSAASGKAGGAAATCPLSPAPNTLWSLAQCSHDLHSRPSCRVYDAKDEYVIIKDNALTKPDAYLIIPTEKVGGIEDPRIFESPFVAFWEYGWSRSQQYPGQPAARIGLAINSEYSRSQNQFHIHISCARPDVSEALEAKDIPMYPAHAVTLPLGPYGNTYEAVRVSGLSGANSPFKVIQDIPGVKGHMADQGIAVIGSQKANEYYVVDTHRGGSNPGHAEELLDQTCQMTAGGN